MARSIVTACIATLMLASPAAAGPPPRGQQGKRDLIEWSNDLLAGMDKADYETIEVAFGVFERAGHADRLDAAAGRLCQLPLTAAQAQWAVDELGRLKRWRTMRGLLDRHKDVCPYTDYAAGFVADWMASGDRGELERWLSERAGRSPSWRRQYYSFQRAAGTLARTVAHLRAKIEKNPDEYPAIQNYLEALGILGQSRAEELAWLGRIARPRRAVDSLDLGRHLAGYKMHEAAVRLLDLSLATPLTDADRQKVRSTHSMLPEQYEAIDATIRRATKGALARTLLEAGQKDRAQKLVEELTGRKDAGPADLAFFELSGQVQLASGQRVVEAKIREARKDNENSVKYWLSRADYYRGRKEPAQEEQALTKAMALRDDREWIRAFDAYLGMLGARKNWKTVDELLHGEIRRQGPRAYVSEVCVRRLLNHLGYRELSLAADDAVLWDWLAGCPTWDTTHGDLLAAFAGAGDRKAILQRMDALVGPNDDASRVAVQAGVYRRVGDHKRAVELYQAAMVRPHKGHISRKILVGSLLFEALEAGDWKLAEGLLPEWDRGHSHADSCIAVGRMAVLAAQQGAADDAMRLYRVLTGHDLTNRNYISQMVRAGMGGRLRAFYEGLLKKDPKNQALLGAMKEVATGQAMLKH